MWIIHGHIISSLTLVLVQWIYMWVSGRVDTDTTVNNNQTTMIATRMQFYLPTFNK